MNQSERLVRQVSRRNEIGETYKPNQDEVFGVINSHTSNLNYLTDALRNPNFLAQISKDCRDVIIKEYGGQNPSKAAVTAFVVVSMARVLVNRSETAFDQNDIPSYVYFRDVASAIKESVQLLNWAEKAITLGRDSVTKWITEEINNSSLKEAHADSKTNALLLFNAELSDGIALLEEDKTGFLLVEEAVKRMKGEKSKFRIPQQYLSGQHIPEFVAIGADLGEKMYKMVYGSLSS